MPKLQTTVDFAEIFKYAEMKYGIQWNPCNSLFFSTEIIQYNRITGWCLEECLSDDLLDEVGESGELTDETKAKIMSFTTSNDEVLLLVKANSSNSWGRLVDIASLIISQFAIDNDLDEFLIV
jgi:hypothetical protein